MKVLNFACKLIAISIIVACSGKADSKSDEILKSFDSVNNSLKSSTDFLDNSNEDYYRYIDAHRESNPDLALLADSIFLETKSTYKYIDSLKEILQSRDDSALENLTIATEFFIKENNGDRLLSRLKKLQRYTTKSITQSSNLLQLNKIWFSTIEVQVRKDWKKVYFENTPTIAALTILSKFQNDCKNAESIALSDIKGQLNIQEGRPAKVPTK